MAQLTTGAGGGIVSQTIGDRRGRAYDASMSAAVTDAAAPAATHEPAHAQPGVWLPTWTLWRREMVRFFRQRNRVASSLITPVILWAMLGMGLNQSFTQPADATATGDSVGYMLYFLPGTATMILLFTAIFSTISVIEDRKEGFMQSVLVSPAPRLSIVLGKVLGGASIAMIHAMLFTAIGLAAVGTWPGAVNLVVALLWMVVLAVALTALGLLIAWPMDSTAGFHAVMMIFLMPMWFVSGAAFPYSGAALPMKLLLLANPLTYGQAVLTALLSGGRATVGLPVGEWIAAALMLAATVLVVGLCVCAVAQPRKDGLA